MATQQIDRPNPLIIPQVNFTEDDLTDPKKGNFLFHIITWIREPGEHELLRKVVGVVAVILFSATVVGLLLVIPAASEWNRQVTIENALKAKAEEADFPPGNDSDGEEPKNVQRTDEVEIEEILDDNIPKDDIPEDNIQDYSILEDGIPEKEIHTDSDSEVPVVSNKDGKGSIPFSFVPPVVNKLNVPLDKGTVTEVVDDDLSSEEEPKKIPRTATTTPPKETKLMERKDLPKK